MTYDSIDKILGDWASRHGLQLCKQYQDADVGTVFLEGLGRERVQIWIDPPTVDGGVMVHAVVYRKRSKDNQKIELPAMIGDLEAVLERAYATAVGWLKEVA